MARVDCIHLCMGGVHHSLPNACAINKGSGWNQEWCSIAHFGGSCYERRRKPMYGKDAKKDLEIVKNLTSSILKSSNKEELEYMVIMAKKIAHAWGYEHGHGASSCFRIWLENKAGQEGG